MGLAKVKHGDMGPRPLGLALLDRRHDLSVTVEIAGLGPSARAVATPAQRIPFRVTRPIQGDGKATPGRAPCG